jgi:hypothetical protein
VGFLRGLPIVPGLVGFVIGLGTLAGEFTFGVFFAKLEEAFACGVGPAGGARHVLALGQRKEHVVEVLGEAVDGLGRGGGAGIEAGEMRQQQPRVKAPPLAHRLAPEPDRFGGAVERAGGEDLLGRLARMDQRRIPPGGKPGIAATAHISRLLRNPRHPRRHPHLPVPAEVFEEAGDADGGEFVGVREGGSAPFFLPSRTREGALFLLPSRKREGLGVGPSFFFRAKPEFA